MRVFLTGATGFIGSHVLPELVAAGHHVIGLARSNAAARQLELAGAQAHRGTLEQPETLAAGAALADAVVHTAFDHDFSNFVANCEKDGRAIAARGGAVTGSARPLLITSGVGIGSPGPGRAGPRRSTWWIGTATTPASRRRRPGRNRRHGACPWPWYACPRSTTR